MYHVVTILAEKPIRLVAGCREPQEIVSQALWHAGIANTISSVNVAPERSAEEKDAAQRIVEAIFRRTTEAS